MNLALIGMRGVGKSNISRRLGFAAKRPVLSTDVLLHYETGQEIPDFVADHGWPAFREREFEIVTRIAALDQVIVDCGGGIIVDLDDDGTEIYSERCVAALKTSGPVVWLRGDVDRLAAKTAGDPQRPALHDTRSAAEIMRRREPFYARAADVIIDVEDRKRSRLARELALQFADELGLDDELRATLRGKLSERRAQ
ncbi:MAG: shikimate kinase [Candidatus Nanopelagicales bacterium]